MVSSLEITREAGVACLTFNRPDKRNAIDDATRDALAKTFAGFEDDIAVRVVILTGAGTAFCARVSPRRSTLSTSRSSRRSMASRSAAASRWRSPATSASPRPARDSG